MAPEDHNVGLAEGEARRSGFGYAGSGSGDDAADDDASAGRIEGDGETVSGDTAGCAAGAERDIRGGRANRRASRAADIDAAIERVIPAVAVDVIGTAGAVQRVRVAVAFDCSYYCPFAS